MIEELSGDFFQQLRGFYYTAQTGGLRKAAHFMNRNPSTISWQIRQLEQELGVVLFDRYKKSLRITPEGERLLAWTISTFELLRGMKSDVSSPSGVLRGTVSVSSNLPFSAHVVGVVSAFRKAHPEVRIKIRRALTYEVVDDVASSRVDFGLTGMTAESSNCELEELFTSRPLLVVPAGNEFRLPERPTPDDLGRLPFISFLAENMEERGDPYFDTSLRSLPRPLNIVLSVNNYHLMLRYVKQGLGVAVMDEMCLSASAYGAAWDDVVAYPLDHVLPVVRCGACPTPRRGHHARGPLGCRSGARRWPAEDRGIIAADCGFGRLRIGVFFPNAVWEGFARSCRCRGFITIREPYGRAAWIRRPCVVPH